MAFTKDDLPPEGSFKSAATDEAGFNKDLADWVLTQRHLAGSVNSSTGFTTPYNRDSIQTLDDVFATASGWQRDQQLRKGGSEFDTMSTPDSDSYRQRRYDFISKEEGTSAHAYPDADDKSIGNGFYLGRPDARQVLSKVLGVDEARFNALHDGRDQLKPSEIRNLFDYNVQEAESVVHNKFKDIDLPEHQRIALVSMAYNNPSLIGPKITEAIRSGDQEAALNEILHNSNAKKNPQLAARRYREAFSFGGTDVASVPPFKAYMKDYA